MHGIRKNRNVSNKKGQRINVTELSQDPIHIHQYIDSIKLGQVTHYCGVQERNHTKKRGKEADKMIPPELKYERDPESMFRPCLIVDGK
jgi:hypothetical protein